MKKIALFLVFAVVTASCIYDKAALVAPTDTPIPTTDPTAAAPESKAPSQLACAATSTVPTTICFDTQVLPIIYANCTEGGCHDSKTKADGYDFTTHGGILKGLVVGNSKNSKIYTEMASGKMPESPRKMAVTQIAIIKQWIDEGAKNNACGAVVVDAANPTFAKTIKPIIDDNCVGCHQTKAAQASVILDNYASVKNYVDNRKLWHVINYHTGYVGMPENRKLAACQIDAFKKWIDAGAMNN